MFGVSRMGELSEGLGGVPGAFTVVITLAITAILDEAT